MNFQKSFKLFFVLFFLPIILLGQVKINSWSFKGNRYYLNVEFNTTYQLQIKDGKKILEFPNVKFDESKPNEFFSVQKELFVEIPYNSTPQIDISEGNSSLIDAQLEVNPRVTASNDSTLTYTSGEVKPNIQTEKAYEIVGFFEYENKRYAHLRFRPIHFDYSARMIKKMSDYNVVLTFNFQLPSNSIVNTPISLQNSFVNNPKIESGNHLFKKNDISDLWIDFTADYIKISLAADGVYRITYNDLQKMSSSVLGANPKTFRLFLKGNEIPIFVYGEDDLRFDQSDYIEFIGTRNYGDGKYRKESEYGKPYNEYLDRYTDSSYYWLTWGNQPGKRIVKNAISDSKPDSTLRYYYHLEHLERNQWFDFLENSQVRSENPDWIENKTWNDATQQNVGTIKVPLPLKDIYPNRNAKAFAKVTSYASNEISKAHKIGISFNSQTTIQDQTDLDYTKQKVLKAIFNSSSLKEGTNTVDIYSLATSASLNVIRHDWYEFEYPRYLKNYENKMIFDYKDYFSNSFFTKFVITNLPNEKIIVYKQNGNSIFDISNYSIIKDTLFFNDTLKTGNQYFVFSESKILKPILQYSKKFIDLGSSQNQAEYILITHPDFLTAANDYAAFIKSNYKIQTAVINVVDIYDQYNFGLFAAEPIKNFLQQAYNNWQLPKPKYLFLVGDATYDYYGNRTQWGGAPYQKNYVPSYGAPVSDNWFVSWDTTKTYLPNLLVGRLPINSVQELINYQNKHQKYISTPFNVTHKTYLFFSGGNLEQYNLLKSIQQSIIDSYVKPKPIGGIANHFYKTFNPNTNFGPFSADYVQSKIDDGSMIISYLGHSGTQTWDNGIVDANQVKNKNDFNPLVSDFGCSTGKFAEPDIKSFSEEFVIGKNAQAIAYIGNSSLGFTSTAYTFPDIFYKKIFKERISNIAEAHRQAKIELLSQYGATGTYVVFVLTNTLIGDPIVSLPIPNKPNLSTGISDLTYLSESFDDQEDSVSVKLVYHNLGKVTDDLFNIQVFDKNSNQVFEKNIKVKIPLFQDSLVIQMPIKNRSGLHELKITLDTENKIDELLKNDNMLQTTFFVSSRAIKFLFPNRITCSIKNPITIINSPQNSEKTKFILEYATDKDFSKSIQKVFTFDSMFTSIEIDKSNLGKRLWFRLKDANGQLLNEFSAVLFDSYAEIFSDSLSVSHMVLNGLKYSDNSIRLDSLINIYDVLSAGSNDGATAIISLNKQTYIPENTLFGYHVCVFDSKNRFIKYANFNLYEGGANANTKFINMLDSVATGNFVLIAINGDGYLGLTQPLRNKFKEFGCNYADSIRFRSSWAFIGKRGATSGSVSESFHLQYKGKASTSMTFASLRLNGAAQTEFFQPLGSIKAINVNTVIPNNTKISVQPIIKYSDGNIDSLTSTVLSDGLNQIGQITKNKIESLQLKYQFDRLNEITPLIKYFDVIYSGMAELLILPKKDLNPVLRDSVEQGETINYTVDLVNAGALTAGNVKVKVDLQRPDNTTEQIFETTIDSIMHQSTTKISFSINTEKMKGMYQLLYSIDPENKITELYKDNNFYSIPIYVRPNTKPASLKLTFDGNDIINGDFISPNPNIRIELNDQSLIPIKDTSAVQLILNNRRIYFSNNPSLAYSYSSSNPKFIVDYKPTLENGSYILKVLGKNATGQLIDSTGLVRNFSVKKELQLLNVFSYPNPMKDETYFTFKLTQIPDEMKIRIYTLAGRMIKEFNLTSAELKYDFNKIYWDGRDTDGDLVANGVYLYKVIIKKGSEISQTTQKLAVVR